uniref:Integrase catalytic domain-containing protein n=1 Tax=Tanacetum cinerariifolium TaxID=118510 RepID=A0A6L2KVU5_TANCI|nr:hypothetical protein [Tanacetum cinerariifolium]
MTTLAEHIIVTRAENRPPMLEKPMYDSWASRICLFIKGNKHGRMILDSIDYGLLSYTTVEENRQTIPQKYSELTEAQQLQDDCDVQATNIILHGLPPDVVIVQQVQGRQNHNYASTRNKGIATTSKGNFTGGQPRVEASQILDVEQLSFLATPGISKALVAQQTIPQNSSFQTEDLDAYDSDCDDLSSAKAVSMANLSSCDLEVLSEDTNSFAPNDLLVLSLVEQMTHHIALLDKENQTNKMVNESLTAELERYKKVTILNKDLIVIAKEHAVIFVIDNEETLILEEESRSKMLDKQNDPISIEKKIKISLIDYSTLNRIKEDFGIRFVTQKELSTQQAFWLKHSSLSETPVKSHTPVRIEAPSELPKIFQRENFGVNLNAPTFNQLFEINELKAQLQEKDTVIRNLKDRIKSLNGNDSLDYVKKDINEIETINIELEHRNSKGKNVVDTAVSKPSATIALGMFTLDIEPISPKLKNNRDAHEVYIEKTIEYTDTLCGFEKRARTQNPSEPLLESACMFTKHIQELLVYVSQTCPNSPKPSEKLTNSLKTKDSNKPLLTSTRVKPTTRASGSKLSGNTKNNRITRPSSSNQKNKVEDHSRKVKSSLNKMNSVSKLVNSGCSKHMTGNRSQLINFVCKFLGTVKFGNDHIAKIMGYEYYQMGNVTISQVYYVEGLDGVDLLKGSRVRGLPKIKYQNDHLCSIYALDKSKKHSYKPKAEDSIQEKLYLMHIYLCGPIRVQSIRRRKFILVIVDDFSRFKWVKILRSKDEGLEFVIKFLKMTQVRLNATIRNIRTDNGTEFVNQTLRDYYKEVRISHQILVARTPQQNGVIERRNRTLIEVARTMLIFSKDLLSLWAEAVATACYTQNRSTIQKRHNKTPYALLHDRKPDLSYLHVFGALCYPTNDGKDLGKSKPKVDIGISVGYSLAKKTF